MENLQLCEACRALQLDRHLVFRGPSGYLEPGLVTLRPAQCALCRLIDGRRRAQRVFVPDNGAVAVKAYATGTAERNAGTECSETVRRFQVYLASSPNITIAKFWPCVFPVPSLRQLCDVGQFAALPFPTGRLIEPITDIRLLRHWIRLCSTWHGDSCSRPYWIPSNKDFPTNFRLIDLKAGCVVEPTVKLSYFALSYVWGPSKDDLCATSANIDRLKEPCSLFQEPLPKTVRDAMKLASELGSGYLWVDRLCILQDDEVEKSVQIPRMDSIYSLAELTIAAATGSGAHDGIAGLSIPRSLDQDTCQISSDMALMTFPTEFAFPSSIYSRRGWTLQERLLSRRILIFTQDQVFWSCCSADWTERLSLEPCASDTNANPWVIPRIHLGNCEHVGVEFYRDFSRQQYNMLPRFYALKEFSDEADALDAITGLFHRISHVTGDEFYWGHLLASFFDQSLSWRKTTLYLERRTAMCPFRGMGTPYSVHFPSWSWLGWKAALRFVIDLNLISIPNALPNPEIVFFHLDIDGQVKRLVPPMADTECSAVDRSQLLRGGASGSWKGEVQTPTTSSLSESIPFRDSGRLLFWTSHASLPIQADQKVRAGCVRIKINSLLGQTIGHISELTLASDNGAAWPFFKLDKAAPQSFIVLCRKYATATRDGERTLSALPRLKVMWIRWEDAERRTASRVSVGEVDEQLWIDVERDWRLVVLQ